MHLHFFLNTYYSFILYSIINGLIVQLGVGLFGETYSGLEYDYRGLCHVYEKMSEFEKYVVYSTKLEEWKQRRLDEANVRKNLLVLFV